MKIKQIKLCSASSALLLATLFPTTSVHASCSENDYLATICTTAATFCPRGYANAKGQFMPISSNTALFSLIGTTYGGDGRTTFKLPDLRGRVPVGVGTGPGLRTVKLGQILNSGKQSLNLLSMPSHTHSTSSTVQGGNNANVNVKFPLSSTVGTSAEPLTGENQLHTVAQNALANPEAKIYGSTDTSNSSHYTAGAGDVDLSTATLKATAVVQPSGGGVSFTVNDPALTMNYCIAVQGLYPSRS